MPNTPFNKFRAAVEVLQRRRDSMIESLADEILDQSDDLLDSGFLFNEFLESQGTRVHFLALLLSQLEMSAEQLDERLAVQPPQVVYEDYQQPVTAPVQSPRKRKPRAKKVADKAPPEGSPEDA